MERLRLRAALAIQRVARGFAARRVVRALRRDRAAVKIQAARRRMLGRRRAMQKRAEAATVLLDALWNVQVEAANAPGKFTETKSAAWLEKVNEALKFKEQAEQEEAERQLNSQRLAACEGLPGGTDDGQLQRPTFDGGQWPAFGRAMAALDRGLAAIAAAQARARLRSRALLLTQVGDGHASCDGETRRALLPEEGILARLPLTDAVDEVASLLHTSWVMTVASRGRRVEGIPKSEEILKESITILHRRLVAELGGAKRVPELGRGDIYDEVLEKVTRAEKSATDAAERQANSVRDSSLKAMKAELTDAMKEAEALLEAALAAAHKVSTETEKVKKTFRDKADEEEVALRKERQSLHEQTVALHTLAMNTQIEKERLEVELGERKPRAKVFQHILVTVKDLQEHLRVQEVNGTSNRKSQGLLAHTLRALEARATKGMEDCYAKMRAEGLVPEVMKDADDSCIHKFKPSENVRKKVERQEEQEKQFRAALETEVKNMHAVKKAEAAKEAAVLGAQLRAEAEKHCAAVKACVDRLLRWRSAADIVRPWLGSLAPLARTHAAVAAAAEHVRGAGGQGPEASPASARAAQLRPVVRAVLRRFESLSCSALRAGESESPRAGKLDQVLGRLHGFQKTIGALCKEFPDVDLEKDFAAAKRPPQEVEVEPPLEAELDVEGDALVSPVHSPERGVGARSSKDKAKPATAAKAPNPPGMTGWAGLAALGSELCTLPGGMGGGQPQANSPAPSSAPRGGPPKGPPPSAAAAPPRPQAKAAPAATSSATLAPGAAAGAGRLGPRGVAVSPAATPSGSSKKPPAASPARAESTAAPQAKKGPAARR